MVAPAGTVTLFNYSSPRKGFPDSYIKIGHKMRSQIVLTKRPDELKEVTLQVSIY